MRILHILSTPRAEGTPNLVLDWLAMDEHEQEVFVLNSSPADLTERLRSGAHWHEEADFFAQGWRKFIGMARRVRRICAKRRPDVVICWPTGFANWVCLGARLGGVKRLLVHCGNPPNRGLKADWTTRYVMWPLRWLGARCVCCSKHVRDEFRSIPLVSGDLFHVVYNCSRGLQVSERAEIARRKRPVENRKYGIMVATLERHKDHLTLLEAMSQIRKEEPAFTLRLVGDGSLRQELESRAAEFGLNGAVEFLGTRCDVPELLGMSDLFIFSTTPQEGLGSALLEALAARLPVVASDVPACRELLAGGRYGVLVSPRNPVALAEAVVGALRHPAETGDGMDYARSFSPGRMTHEYLSLLSFKQGSSHGDK
jgi:glycosyltransferase involved in cell wall biosynthesis